MSDPAATPDEEAPLEPSDPAIDEELAAPVAESDVEPVIEFRVMHVESVLYDLTDSSPFVHLTEAESPYRYVAIPIGLPEAVALHHALSGIDGRRPGTHELVSTVLARLRSDVIAARIVRYEGGVYYAELDLMTPAGREVFDCRTSDALILAMRQSVPAPVLCAESILGALYTESN